MKFAQVSAAVFTRTADLYVQAFGKHYEANRVQIKPHHIKGIQGIAGFNIGIDGAFSPLPLRETMEAIQSFNING